MPPFGGFCLDPGEKERRTHYFFAAGSGITPIFSMIHSVLEAEPHSVAHLVYGNRNDKSIIFKDTLAELQEQHPESLTVCHVLSSPSMSSWFTPWRSGKIDKDVIGAFIGENPPYAQDAQYYICGPGGMNRSVRQFLTELDVPDDRIHMESFGGAKEDDLSVKGIAATATIHLDGESHTIPVDADQTVLEAACKAGVNPPFSCQSGVCGACRAKLSKGTVHMRSRPALEDAEVADGTILTCQSVATSDAVELSYS
jgi:ring-1,2-phenylacetyl-CoA epoxidase subunit PaaE